jgi:imidazolonepropionase-like amidohydrolase
VAGRYADLVWVYGDPLTDITILKNQDRVALVIKGGDIVADRRAQSRVAANA